MNLRSLLSPSIVTAILAACATLAVGCSAHTSDAGADEETGAAEQDYTRSSGVKVTRTNLVSDQPGAVTTDAHLVNAWGIAFNPAGPAWVSNAGSGTTTVYDAAGKLLLTVDVPAAPGSTEASSPTGQVFNATSGFAGDKFILANEHGTIVGWQPSGGARTRVDRSSTGAVYKGLAIAAGKIFATDFFHGRIDVFDASYAPVATSGFVDTRILPGYAPFNIQALDGVLYVTYAKRDAAGEDDVKGAGNGFVDAFDTSGKLLGRIASGGALDAPWGLALAPASFGKLAGKLLVGNFGDGTVNVFDPAPVLAAAAAPGNAYGAPNVMAQAPKLGFLLDGAGKRLVVDGLWALAVSPSGQLFFTAGPSDEAHGSFGTLTVAP